MKLKSMGEDTTADSMIILVICTTVLAFGLMYTLLSFTYNPTIEAINGLIAQDMVTTDTTGYINLSLNMWKTSPFFVVIGLVLFCFERCKGTDLPVHVYFEYMALMLIGLYVSVYLIFSFGLSLDMITTNLDASILTDVSAEWDTSGPRGTISKMVYYFCLLPGFVTALLFMIHPILMQKETREVFSRGDREDGFKENDIELGQV